MTNNYYRGAKVNQNAQQNQSVEKPADGYVYRGVRHQAQQQSDCNKRQEFTEVQDGSGGRKNGQMQIYRKLKKRRLSLPFFITNIFLFLTLIFQLIFICKS